MLPDRVQTIEPGISNWSVVTCLHARGYSVSVMGNWWNDTGRVKRKCSEKNLSQCHSVRHKPHVDYLWIESVFLQGGTVTCMEDRLSVTQL